MKVVIAVIVVAIAVAMVWSEHCNDVTECTNTNCNTATTHLECEHHLCSCIQTAPNCTAKTDCSLLKCDHDRTSHCLDNTCKCLKDSDITDHAGPGHHGK